MSEIAYYLRLLVQADKEAVITPVTLSSDTPSKFSSELTSEQTRKGIAAYNNSDSGSGECYYGFTAVVAPGTGMPIPKGAMVNIPVADVDAIDLYFVGTSGEIGDLRVIEVA